MTPVRYSPNTPRRFSLRALAYLGMILLTFSRVLPQTYLFDHYNVANGLPSNWITTITQDSRGYIWGGGDGGVFAYDGVSFRTFGPAEGLPVTIIWGVVESRKSPGTLYISCHLQGLGVMRDGRITMRKLGTDVNLNVIGQLLEDHTGDLWCVTNAGLVRVHGDSVVRVSQVPDTVWIGAIHGTADGSIYIGGANSLMQLRPPEWKLEATTLSTTERMRVSCISEDSDGSLWLGTMEGHVLHIKDNRIIAQRKTPFEELTSASQDRYGNIWFGSTAGAICVSKQLFPDGGLLQLEQENGLRDSHINVCFVDREDNVWFGGRAEGVSKLSHRNILQFRINDFIPDLFVGSIAADRFGHLFVGAPGIVWELYKNRDGAWQRHPHRVGSTVIKPGDGRPSLAIAPNGELWVASHKGGLTGYVVHHKEGRPSVLTPQATLRAGRELPDVIPVGVAITDDHQLWYNIRGGPLIQVDLGSRSVVGRHEVGGEYVGGTAQAIIRANDGTLWVGTFAGGLSQFVPDGRSYRFERKFTVEDGLPSDRIRSILQRRNGDIWIGTRFNGIAVYRNGTFTTIDARHGLLNNAVWELCEDEEGRVWVGTSLGLQYVETDSIRFHVFPRLSGQVGSIGVVPGRKTIWCGVAGEITVYEYASSFSLLVPPLISIVSLRANGMEKELRDDLVLPADENFCVIRFNGLSFKNELRYVYRMDGLDTMWSEPTSERAVTFASLSHGSYTFEVKAITQEGLASEQPATLAFTVLRPWYLSWWTIGLYVALGSLLVFLYVKVRTRRLEKHSHELEHVVAQRTAEVVEQRNQLHDQAERLREMDRLKSHFFTNISHEFRTPLTVILGHLDRLRKRQKEKPVADYDVMERNARRLLQLINQLLDLSRLEAGAMTLRAARTDIVAFVRRTVAAFTSYADHKGVALTLNGAAIAGMEGHPAISVFFDHNKIEKVLSNLLSNALKFTPRGGHVDVSISGNETAVEIVVSDTGHGIPDASLPYVFDRFYQVEDAMHSIYEGTGIGLALVKELVELHHGHVSVRSEYGKGTAFSVQLPMGSGHLDEGEIVEVDVGASPQGMVVMEPDSPAVDVTSPASSPDDTTILIVEDNADLRDLIKEQLTGDYAVIEAANGNDGLRLAELHLPDLIVSDIMMPGMDGYALCSAAKSGEKTNHIPVILLTARAAVENKLEGLEIGADDYLTKPFNPEELKLRVRNLIRGRRQLREKFRSEMLLRPADVTVPSTHKIFLEKVTASIEKHLASEDFSVEMLAEEVGMSRAQLHRKLKALTNKAPNELIRSFRLQRAAELIRQDAGTLAEIAYQVGFGSQAYFTRCFVEEFGVTPSEFRRGSGKPM